MHYLMVVRVPSRRVGPRKVALESAFREHLIKLRESFEGKISRFTVVVPTMSEARYKRDTASLSEIDEENDGFRFVLMHTEGCGIIRYNLVELPRNAIRMWSAIKDADLVHSGRDHPTNIFNFVGSVCAVLRRKPLVFVVDIDNRPSARMRFQSDRSSRKGFILEQYVFTPLVNCQIRFASRFAKLLLVKGDSLARDFGNGRAVTKTFIDVVHDESMVISEERLKAKHDRQSDPNRPLQAVFFGRLVSYKGLDHSIRAIQHCRRLGVAIHFRVIGNGPELGNLQRLVSEFQLEDYVSFSPAVPYAKCLEALVDFDILIATPLSSDTPRNLFDAMSQGLSTCAYQTPYYNDFIQHGVVISKWGDPSVIGNSLRNLSVDRELLREHSRKAVAFARENTQDIWLKRRATWTSACFPLGSADE